MTNSPMRKAANLTKSPNGLLADSEALDRMDRWAGQVAAAMSTAVRRGAVTVGSRPSVHAIARQSYGLAEALERERTRRMKG